MIKLLFFARLQEEFGEENLEVQAEGWTISELKQWLEESYALNGLSYTMTAVNEEFTEDSTSLNAGDVIAFIPPVSGG